MHEQLIWKKQGVERRIRQNKRLQYEVYDVNFNNKTCYHVQSCGRLDDAKQIANLFPCIYLEKIPNIYFQYPNLLGGMLTSSREQLRANKRHWKRCFYEPRKKSELLAAKMVLAALQGGKYEKDSLGSDSVRCVIHYSARGFVVA